MALLWSGASRRRRVVLISGAIAASLIVLSAAGFALWVRYGPWAETRRLAQHDPAHNLRMMSLVSMMSAGATPWSRESGERVTAAAEVGQWMRAALDSGDPRSAATVLVTLLECDVQTNLRQRTVVMRDLAPDEQFRARFSQTLAEMDDYLARCWAIPDEVRDRRLKIAEAALLAGTRGVATEYGRLVEFSPPAYRRQALIDAMRADIRDGDHMPAVVVVALGDPLRLPRVEAQAHWLLAKTIHQELSPPGAPALPDRAVPALTLDEERLAKDLFDQWFTEMKAGEAKRQATASK